MLKEENFRQVFASGGVRSIELHINSAGLALVFYKLTNSQTGYIYTKRGDLKTYKPETAMRFLKDVGCSGFSVDMSQWCLSGQLSL